jgi:hypothetical protein
MGDGRDVNQGESMENLRNKVFHLMDAVRYSEIKEFYLFFCLRGWSQKQGTRLLVIMEILTKLLLKAEKKKRRDKKELEKIDIYVDINSEGLPLIVRIIIGKIVSPDDMTYKRFLKILEALDGSGEDLSPYISYEYLSQAAEHHFAGRKAFQYIFEDFKKTEKMGK